VIFRRRAPVSALSAADEASIAARAAERVLERLDEIYSPPIPGAEVLLNRLNDTESRWSRTDATASQAVEEIQALRKEAAAATASLEAAIWRLIEGREQGRAA
jgi:hypothetical protein